MSEQKDQQFPTLTKEIEARFKIDIEAKLEKIMMNYAANPIMAQKIEKEEISQDSVVQMAVTQLILQTSQEVTFGLLEKSATKIEVKTTTSLEKYIESFIGEVEKSYPKNPELISQFIQAVSELDFTQMPKEITSKYSLGLLPEKAFVGFSEMENKDSVKPLLDISHHVLKEAITQKMFDELSQKNLDSTVDIKGVASAMADEIFKIQHGKQVGLVLSEQDFYKKLEFAQEVLVDGKKSRKPEVILHDIMEKNYGVDNLKKALFDKISAARGDELDTKKSKKDSKLN